MAIDPFKVLEDIQSNSSKNKKSELLKANCNNEKLNELLHATFDGKRLYHIRKFNDKPEHTPKSRFNAHSEFLSLLSKLENREIVGNQARSEVETFLSYVNPNHVKWYSRVIRKDLKCGFSADTAVKAGFVDIPVFDVMLAKDAKNCKKLNEIIKKGVYVSPKLDGYRCLAILDEGSVTLMSRNGTVYENFPKVEETLAKSFPTGKHVFDGEIMSNDFQAMQKSAFANKRKTVVGDVYYAIFGYVPYDEWMSQDFKMVTSDRLAILDKLIDSVDNFEDSGLCLVDQIWVKDSLKAVYDLQHIYEKQGYEGAMALPNIPYFLGKKSNRLLKFKTMETQDCVITGLYEGKSDTRLEGMMGGVVLRQENGKQCECGSGWDDMDRTIMWENPELYIGETIEVKYQELTKDGIMRFPVFMRFRNVQSRSL